MIMAGQFLAFLCVLGCFLLAVVIVVDVVTDMWRTWCWKLERRAEERRLRAIDGSRLARLRRVERVQVLVDQAGRVITDMNAACIGRVVDSDELRSASAAAELPESGSGRDNDLAQGHGALQNQAAGQGRPAATYFPTQHRRAADLLRRRTGRTFSRPATFSSSSPEESARGRSSLRPRGSLQHPAAGVLPIRTGRHLFCPR